MRRTPVRAPWLVVCLATLAGCATAGNEPVSGSLDGRRWRLVELNGRPAVGIGNPREPHLIFTTDSGRVGGSTGCNHLSGPVTVRGDSLRFGPTITTKMACLDTLVMRQEADFVGALGGTERYQLSGDTLVLLGQGGTLARFVGAAAAPETGQ